MSQHQENDGRKYDVGDLIEVDGQQMEVVSVSYIEDGDTRKDFGYDLRPHESMNRIRKEQAEIQKRENEARGVAEQEKAKRADDETATEGPNNG